jgi:hypothetical protein
MTNAGLVCLGSDALSLDHIQQRTRDLYGQIYRVNESFMTRTAAPVPATVMATGLMALAEGMKLSMLSSPTDVTPRHG